MMEFLSALLAFLGWLMAVLCGFGFAQDDKNKKEVSLMLGIISFGLITGGFWLK